MWGEAALLPQAVARCSCRGAGRFAARAQRRYVDAFGQQRKNSLTNHGKLPTARRVPAGSVVRPELRTQCAECQRKWSCCPSFSSWTIRNCCVWTVSLGSRTVGPPNISNRDHSFANSRAFDRKARTDRSPAPRACRGPVGSAARRSAWLNVSVRRARARGERSVVGRVDRPGPVPAADRDGRGRRVARPGRARRLDRPPAGG